MAYTSTVTFTEENDPRAVYAGAALAIALFLLDQLILHLSSSPTRSIYVAGLFATLLTAALWLYCLLGCIWHPIPEQDRINDGMTTLHLSEADTKSTSEASPGMTFGLLEDQTLDNSDTPVDSSQIELRDPIQWRKMALTTLCVICCAVLIALRNS
jgi:hypothetical protein